MKNLSYLGYLMLNDVLACKACELRSRCNSPVPSIDEPRTKSVMFVGGYPDSESDLMGEPFAGRDGRHLNRLLDRADVSRESIHITYMVKCYPGSNEPKKVHVTECIRWLFDECSIVKPKVIVTFGPLPTRICLCLKRNFKLSDYVGAFKEMQIGHGIKAFVAPWYTPSYVLSRGKSADEATVQFFKQVKEYSIG